jgi:hypothetical protein
MSREAIKLGKPETLPSGKIRWKKMWKRKQWKSSAYDQESRRNRSLAWQEFVEWREIQQGETDLFMQVNQNTQELVKLTTTTPELYSELERLQTQSKAMADLFRRQAEIESEDELREIVARQKQTAQEIKAESNEFETAKLIDQWLVFRLSDVRAGAITAGTLDNNRNQLEKFAEFCPNILHADEMKFLEFRAELQEQIAEGASPFTCRDILTTTKNFLEWCGDTAKVIEPISNLRKRGTGIKVPQKRAIKTWSDEAIKDLFLVVDDVQRLFYLLMLNTGAYEGDIGTWRHIGIDDRGRAFNTYDPDTKTLTFKRHKEQHEDGVPTVTYRLWDETADLLEQYRADHPEYLLTSEDNTTLWIDELHPDKSKKHKRKRKNLIGRQYGRYRTSMKKKGFWGTLDDLRKTSVSKLDAHDEFARYSLFFAGHSPRTVMDRFYRNPSQERFDAAVIWLGEQFGFSTANRE